MRRTAGRLIGTMFVLLVVATLWSRQSFAQELGAIYCVWEGRLGLGRDSPFQIWRIALRGDKVKVFVIGEGEAAEGNPGKWRVERLGSNISAITSGMDNGGQW